jgi:hypothetical protein
MIKSYFLPLLVFMVLAVIAGGLVAESHPRLLFDADRIPELRERIDREPYRSMVEELVSFAEEDTTSGVEYGQSVAAMNCGFLYVLTGDSEWAEKAREYTEMRISDTSSGHGWDRNLKGLRLYWHGRAVALAYDFCHGAESWAGPVDPLDPEGPRFRDQVREKLKAQADRIYLDGGTEQNRNPASNWQNNRFASAGLIYLAIEESLSPEERERIPDCLDKVGTYLFENMDDGPDSRGYNIEALGYTMYPWSFTGPFAIAAERNGYGRVGEVAPAATAYGLWTVYSLTARIPHVWGTHFGIHPDFGDDNNIHRGEGTYGLSFYFSPEFLHPGLRYWYDRIVGDLGDRTWDRERGGTIYSILYYPEEVEPRAPDSIKEWTNAMLETGGNGYFAFRDRYEDGDDLIAAVYAKFRGNKGHSGPDALSFRIVGLGAPFAVGGGRYGPDINAADTGRRQDAFLRSMNTLYPVDPGNELSISGESGRLVGTPQRLENGGGSVVLNIGTSNVGTGDHTRRFLADYSDRSGANGVYVISDTSEDGNWWQFCQVDLDSSTAAITTSGNTFLVENPNGSSLKGTVLYPASNYRWKTGSRIRGSSYGYLGERYNENEYVHFQSDDGDYLVVMTVCEPGREHPEVVSLAGEGANVGRVVRVGQLEVAIDGDQIGRGVTPGEAPLVTIDSPEPLETLAPGPFDLRVEGRAYPGSAPLEALEIYYGPVSEYLGDSPLDPVTGRFEFIIPELGLGHHLFRVKAVGEDGLERYSEYIPVSVHVTQPPRVRISSPADGAVFPAGADLDFVIEAVDPDPDGGIHSLQAWVNGVEQAIIETYPPQVSLAAAEPGSYRIEVTATDASGETGSARSQAFVSLGQLPEPWIHFDTGPVELPGSATLEDGVMTLRASGEDIWDERDAMHFAFQPFEGDGELVVRVLDQENTHGWAKVGPMFRASADPGSPYVGVFATPGNGVTVQSRSSAGGGSSSQRIEGTATPVWLKLVREGDRISGFYRKALEDPWTEVAGYPVDLPDTSLAGIAATSHQADQLMAASLDSLYLREPVHAPRVELVVTEPEAIKARWFAAAGVRYQLMRLLPSGVWAYHGEPVTGAGEMVEVDLSGSPYPVLVRAVLME